VWLRWLARRSCCADTVLHLRGYRPYRFADHRLSGGKRGGHVADGHVPVKAARHELVEPQLHIVAPSGENAAAQLVPRPVLLDDIFSDFSHQGWKQDDCVKDLIALISGYFANFYGFLVPALDRARLKRLRSFVLRAVECFHRVTVALHQSRGGIRAVFEAWEEAFQRRKWAARNWSANMPRPISGRIHAIFRVNIPGNARASSRDFLDGGQTPRRAIASEFPGWL
jgi:hypothetical protein